MLSLLTACSSVPVVEVAAVQEPHPSELTVWLLPGTGLEPLITEYDREHPELKIRVVTAQYADVHSNLQTALAAGYGAPDVVVIEGTFIDRFKSFSSHFHNLYDYGAGALSSEYLDWKWINAESSDRSFLLALPTDIGPLMLAYRRDLFEKAGLPSDRQSVSRLLQSWDDYIEVGKALKEKAGTKMFNNLRIMFRLMFSQLDEQYFDRSTGRLILEENTEARKAWEYTMKAAELGLSANIETYLPEWGVALEKGSFAVMLAPSWMTAIIRNNAPKAAGKWDLAELGPQQYGNWGGSYLALPKEGSHPEESFELIRYLTSPEQQLRLFSDNGNFPSTPGVYENKAIRDKIDPYFNNSPVGKMYSEAARKVKPTFKGPLADVVETALDEVLQQVDNGTVPPAKAWNEALRRTEAALALYP
ncbi:ABC transporter substrate-binding protein [Paenibacillus kobensis]|uniref:ABC transporter substrate-binding protein n=1 Tax=Paenibacillus kobensis TaxID=59841 RepID=UPI0013E287D0|nr:extracellular solute-binding protein [Paenibacillus kobensis]